MTFATPLFLIAMMAGLIPVLLHLINRQKAKPLPFSTLRFLRLSVQRTRRRKYLHDYVLLLLRVVGLLLIAIGLAQPTINRFGNFLGRGAAATDVVLILDNSASMSTIDARGSRWEAAAGVSQQLVDQLGDADSLALLLTCGPPRPELERLQRNHEMARQALDECRPGHQRADLAMRIRAADKLLAESKAPNKEIYVVTDMQEISWQSLRRDDSREAADAPPIVLVDLHGDAAPNVAIKSVKVNSAGPVAGLPMQVAVVLLGDLEHPRQRHVELVLDGNVLAISPTITIEPNATAEHTFQFKIEQPGIHHGEVRLVGNDACSLDDKLFFAVTVTPHVPVAVIKPRDQPIAYLDDSYYLERALSPVTGGDWTIHATSLTMDALVSEALGDYAVVFCVNLPALDAQEAGQLRDYVRRGGHVVWTCGDNVMPAAYAAMNQSAQGELVPVQLLGVRGPTADQPDGWHVGSIDQTHPALAPLAEPASLYQSVQVYHYLDTALNEGDSVRVLARLDNGAPLLVEHKIGSGSVLLLTTSVHVAWSNLPLRPIFLPLVAGLTFQLADASAAQPQLIAGTPIVTQLDAGDRAELHRPDGATIRLEPGADDESTVRYADTHDVGIYEVHARGASRRPAMALALNLDPDETVAARSSVQAVQANFGDRAVVPCADPTDLAGTIRELREGKSLMELFLLTVLIALIAEAFVANRRIAKAQNAARGYDHARAFARQGSQFGPPQ